MRDITIRVYKASELTGRAKERARDWYRGILDQDTMDDFADPVVGDFKELVKTIGFDIEIQRGHISRPAIFWNIDGNPSGAGFNASWSAGAIDLVSASKIMQDRPATTPDGVACANNAKDHQLINSAIALAHLDLAANGTVTASRDGTRIHMTDYNTADPMVVDTVAESREILFDDLVNDLAKELYMRLCEAYHYSRSAEAVDDAMEANEYEFTNDGTYFHHA